jgi:hypothetical protein
VPWTVAAHARSEKRQRDHGGFVRRRRDSLGIEAGELLRSTGSALMWTIEAGIVPTNAATLDAISRPTTSVC